MPSARDLGLATLCEQTRLRMAMDYAEARCDVCNGSKPEVSDGHENVGFRGHCALESA